MGKMSYCIVEEEELTIDYYNEKGGLIKGDIFNNGKELMEEIAKIPKNIKIY